LILRRLTLARLSPFLIAATLLTARGSSHSGPAITLYNGQHEQTTAARGRAAPIRLLAIASKASKIAVAA
jgi:hypothetical protein